jgi:hypothetical protein
MRPSPRPFAARPSGRHLEVPRGVAMSAFEMSLSLRSAPLLFVSMCIAPCRSGSLWLRSARHFLPPLPRTRTERVGVRGRTSMPTSPRKKAIAFCINVYHAPFHPKPLSIRSNPQAATKPLCILKNGGAGILMGSFLTPGCLYPFSPHRAAHAPYRFVPRHCDAATQQLAPVHSRAWSRFRIGFKVAET